MPAAAHDVMGLKAVSFYPANEGSAVPTHQAIVLLFRTDNGEPLAVMDGRSITEMRTAAVSAAITKYLMPPQSRVLALLGSGVQAQSHLAALSRIAQFEEVRVWSRTPEHARAFAREHGAAAMEAEAAVRGADVIVVATNSPEPVLRGAWLKEGAHVNAVGANRPAWRELDDDAMRHVLVVDSREAVLQESGDVILSGAKIYAEIGEIFAGSKADCAGQTTIFKSVGIAAEDLAAARLVNDAYAALAKRAEGGVK
jgi:thiomorpholine-carboxylate dehydrogenase